MRVALVGPVAPLRGGIAHHTVSLADALVRAGHDVRVLGYQHLYPRWLFPGRDERAPDEPKVRVPVSRALTALNPLRWRAASRALAEFSPDIVAAAWWNPFVTGAVVSTLAFARGRGWRTVVVAHNVSSHDDTRFDRLAWRALASVADGTLVQSAADEAALARLHPRLALARHAHPPYERLVAATTTRAQARAALSIDPADELAVILGNVRPYKGVDIAIRAFGRVRARRPNARLVIVGEIYDNARAEIEAALAVTLGDRVTVLDRYWPQQELALWASAANVVLAPHRRASSSGVVRIAQLCGTPVIASEVGGLPEQLQRTRATLVPAQDEAALARAWTDVLSSPPLSQPITVAEARAEWDSLATTLVALGGVSSR